MDWFAYITRNGRKGHRMGHSRFAVQQTIALRHCDLDINTKYEFKIVNGQIFDALLAGKSL